MQSVYKLNEKKDTRKERVKQREQDKERERTQSSSPLSVFMIRRIDIMQGMVVCVCVFREHDEICM